MYFDVSECLVFVGFDEFVVDDDVWVVVDEYFEFVFY